MVLEVGTTATLIGLTLTRGNLLDTGEFGAGTIARNRAARAGGLFNENGLVWMRNCTVSGNVDVSVVPTRLVEPKTVHDGVGLGVE
jgi:hypothetical protein